MIDHCNMKLGRISAGPDPRVPQLSKHMRMVKPAPSADWSKAVKSYPMLRNDSVGDCTAAGALHQLQTWLNNTGFPDYVPTDDETIALYSATSDYPKSDNGAVEKTVLEYWRTTGIPGPFNTDHIAYAALTPTDVDEIKLAVQFFGGCYLGVELPLTAQTQTVWDVVPDASSTIAAPGSWGGHCLIVVAYDEQYLTVVTWGQLLKVTPAFLQKYCAEAYALLSSNWLADSGISPPGLNFSALQAELQAIHA